jgi:superfamily II DNA or RNA helicase
VSERSAIHLRPYQEDCLKAITTAFIGGKQRVLATMPTGGGKTIVFANLIDRMKTGRALVLAHRDELIHQTVQKIKMVTPDADVGVVKASENQYWTRIVVASVQTVQREARLSQLGQFDLIVVDEAHHAAAETWTEILVQLGAFRDGGPMVCGFTATPDRADKVGLDVVFEEIVFEMPTLDLIRQNYLCDIVPLQVKVEGMDLSRVKKVAGDFAANASGKALLDADAPGYVARALQEYAPGRRSIVFTPTVATAAAMAEAINAAGIPAASLDAKTKTEDRRRIIADLHSGKIMSVANCAVLTEGTDIPPVDCIVIARPTMSRSLYQQMVGRGLRPYPGKEDCVVLDMVGVTGRHKLQTAATLFGIRPQFLKKGEGILQAATEQARQEAIAAEATGKLVAVGVMAFEGARAHWVASGTGKFLLSTGDGMIMLQPSEDDAAFWDAIERPSNGWEPHKIIARKLSLEYAQGVAEDRAREKGAGALIDPNAPWRARDASEKQIALLRRLNVDTTHIITAGQASDAISAAKAGRHA